MPRRGSPPTTRRRAVGRPQSSRRRGSVMPPEPDHHEPDHYVTTHIHTDGPIPGPHSLLTLTSAAYSHAGVPISSFTANVRELPGATLHPIALADWRARAEDWLCTRRASRPPAVAMAAYERWIGSLPG